MSLACLRITRCNLRAAYRLSHGNKYQLQSGIGIFAPLEPFNFGRDIPRLKCRHFPAEQGTPDALCGLETAIKSGTIKGNMGGD